MPSFFKSHALIFKSHALIFHEPLLSLCPLPHSPNAMPLFVNSKAIIFQEPLLTLSLLPYFPNDMPLFWRDMPLFFNSYFLTFSPLPYICWHFQQCWLIRRWVVRLHACGCCGLSPGRRKLKIMIMVKRIYIYSHLSPGNLLIRMVDLG